MSCTHQEDLTAYVDDALPPERSAAVKAHLVTCAACADTERSLRTMVQRLQMGGDAPTSAHFERALVRRLNAVPTPLHWRQLFLSRWSFLVTAGAVALSLFVFLGPLGPPSPPEHEAFAIAEHWKVVESYELLGLDSPDDLDVVASLHELEVLP